MKKILAIMLSLIMVVGMLTGCGKEESKEASTFFKEVEKLQDVKTGVGELELSVDLKGSNLASLLEEESLNGIVDGDTLALKLKLESTTESSSKAAVKMSVKIGTNDYMEFTTIVVDSTKVYVNVGTIVDVIKSIDENAGAQVESVLGQIGASSYISIDLKQLYEAMGEEIPDLTKSTEKLQDVTKKVLENLDKAFSAIEGQDGDDYTLTVESENADEVAEGIVKFCNDSLKSTYTDVIDAYSDILSGNEEVQQQLDELKNKAEDLDEVIDKVKDSQDDISEAIKESKINVTAKVNVSGDEGSRKAELSISTGDIDIPDTSGIESGNINISLTSKITESEASIKDIVPESAVDLTAFITAAMSSYTDSADDTSALY